MKLFVTIIIFSIVVMVAGCSKYKSLGNQDPFGKETGHLYGRLFLFDTLTQRAVNTALAGKKVTLNYKDALDTVNYMYSTTTDAEGYFQFKALRNDKEYRLAYAETVDGKLYTGVAFSKISNDTCRMFSRLAMTGQTGVVFSVTDSSGIPLAAADICVFSSPIPSNNNSCDGSNFSMKSDQYGKYARFNLAPGLYYVFSKITINNIVFQDKQSFVLDNNVKTIQLTLRNTPAPATNGYNVLVLDPAGNALNNVAVCLFTSNILFERDTCAGSNYTTTTNAAGKAVFNNIIPGRYFALADLSLGQFKLLGRDTILIQDKIISDTIRIR